MKTVLEDGVFQHRPDVPASWHGEDWEVLTLKLRAMARQRTLGEAQPHDQEDWAQDAILAALEASKGVRWNGAEYEPRSKGQHPCPGGYACNALKGITTDAMELRWNKAARMDRLVEAYGRMNRLNAKAAGKVAELRERTRILAETVTRLDRWTLSLLDRPMFQHRENPSTATERSQESRARIRARATAQRAWTNSERFLSASTAPRRSRKLGRKV